MRVLSLFSGIGGLDLGLERAGMTVIAQVENDPWCRRVLERHWPDVPKWGDVRTVDPGELPPADLIAGGFPCQPVSTAGKGLGRDDPRWLWPEFERMVRGVGPRWVLVENVPGLALRGMDEVLGGLAACGFDAEWQSVPAAAVGAPHLRWRIFIAARRRLPDASGDAVRLERERRGQQPVESGAAVARDDGAPRIVADAGGSRSPHVAQGETRRGELGEGQSEDPAVGRGGRVFLGDFPASLREWWAAEPAVGRVAHGVPGRVDRLRGLGNAVVPQVAEYVGRCILAADAR